MDKLNEKIKEDIKLYVQTKNLYTYEIQKYWNEFIEITELEEAYEFDESFDELVEKEILEI